MFPYIFKKIMKSASESFKNMGREEREKKKFLDFDVIPIFKEQEDSGFVLVNDFEKNFKFYEEEKLEREKQERRQRQQEQEEQERRQRQQEQEEQERRQRQQDPKQVFFRIARIYIPDIDYDVMNKIESLSSAFKQVAVLTHPDKTSKDTDEIRKAKADDFIAIKSAYDDIMKSSYTNFGKSVRKSSSKPKKSSSKPKKSSSKPKKSSSKPKKSSSKPKKVLLNPRKFF
jgi:hypothetical protein